MPDIAELETFLAGATVSPQVFALRPDYRALLLAVDGIEPGDSDEISEEVLIRAEAAAVSRLATTPVEDLPNIAAWRTAYRAFGAKPQRTRNSLEALTRRAPGGLPRVNRLTDLYNGISVMHQVPLGGEDLSRYASAPSLLRAAGTEPFDTIAGGDPVVEYPEAGEVVWTDAEGVTCRRWNWRQGRRTQLTDRTATALFILDALDPMTDDQLEAAAQDLTSRLSRLGAGMVVASRLISDPGPG